MSKLFWKSALSVSEACRSVKPGLLASLYELRAIPELVRYLVSSERSLVRSLPQGDGRPVLVIPGFLCGDIATLPMRRFLKKIGYRSFAWRQGINWGPGPGVRTRLLHRINDISHRFSEPVTLIGWSLGGVYAREISEVRPDLIREVITLGSPMQGAPESIAVWGMFRWINQHRLRQMSSSIMDYARPIISRNLAIFTRGDGIVPWSDSVQVRGQFGDRAEVRGSHTGLIHNPQVMSIVAHRLAALPEDCADLPDEAPVPTTAIAPAGDLRTW